MDGYCKVQNFDVVEESPEEVKDLGFDDDDE